VADPVSLPVLLLFLHMSPKLIEPGFERAMEAIILSEPRRAIVLLEYVACHYSLEVQRSLLLELLFVHPAFFLEQGCASELIAFLLCLSIHPSRFNP
jgi:hypothetical protein